MIRQNDRASFNRTFILLFALPIAGADTANLLDGTAAAGVSNVDRAEPRDSGRSSIARRELDQAADA